MKKKFLVGLAILFLMFEMVGIAGAYTFEDNFNDRGSHGNWAPDAGNWTYNASPDPNDSPDNYVYVGMNYDQDPYDGVESFLTETPLWYNSGLSIEVSTGFVNDDSGSFSALLFSYHEILYAHDYLYGIGIRKEFSGTTGLSNFYLLANDGDNEIEESLEEEGGFGIASDTKFCLTIAAGVTDFAGTVYKYDDALNKTELGKITLGMNLPVDFGRVALVAGRLTGFENFNITGNPVPTPEPSTMLLLGFGLLGLAGVYRKKIQ